MPTALSQLVDFGTGRVRQHTLRRIFIPLIVVAYCGSLMLAIRPQVRNHRDLNWRYCARPGAPYLLYSFERGDELAGFLLARAVTYLGVRWDYLGDFLAPENSTEVLRAFRTSDRRLSQPPHRRGQLLCHRFRRATRPAWLWFFAGSPEPAPSFRAAHSKPAPRPH
jgi:hypothetical protein